MRDDPNDKGDKGGREGKDGKEAKEGKDGKDGKEGKEGKFKVRHYTFLDAHTGETVFEFGNYDALKIGYNFKDGQS